MRLFFYCISVFVLLSFSIVKYSNIEGLRIKFKKISEDNVIHASGYGTLATPVFAKEGMKFVILKLNMKNEGSKNCVFNFDDVYISTQQDSLYRFYGFKTLLVNSETKIKPQKEIDRTIMFEFPEEMTPRELFIEDKRYLIIEEKE